MKLCCAQGSGVAFVLQANFCSANERGDNLIVMANERDLVVVEVATFCRLCLEVLRPSLLDNGWRVRQREAAGD